MIIIYNNSYDNNKTFFMVQLSPLAHGTLQEKVCKKCKSIQV